MKRFKQWFSRQYKGPMILLGIFIAGLLAVTVYLIQKANQSDRKILQLNFIALLLGLVFEYKRITKKWITVFWTALGAYLLSFFAFARGKGKNDFDLDERLQIWPYYFLGAFVILAAIVQYKSLTKKLTEGITLLLTLALNYWIIANDHWANGSILIKGLVIISIVFSIISIYNAFSYNSLNKGMRLALSIWSTIITLVLSADHFLQLFNHRDIEQLPAFSHSLFFFLQFFLLGISSLYVVHNLTMIGAYLPSTSAHQAQDMSDIHVKRLSEQQVHIADSVIVTIISVAAFTLNYFLEFLPVNFMIWTVIIITPLILYLVHRVFK